MSDSMQTVAVSCAKYARATRFGVCMERRA